MKIDFNNMDRSIFNQFGMKTNELNRRQQTIINRIEDNIKQKNDILEISKEGQLKLKIRNLKEVDKLEGKKEKMEEGLKKKLDFYKGVSETLKDAQKLIKEAMDKNTSMEEKQKTQSDLDEMLGNIEDVVNGVIGNKEKNIQKLDNNAIENNNTIKDNIKNSDTLEKNGVDLEEKTLEDNKIEDVENNKKIDFSKIDILKEPSKAFAMIGIALEAVSEEIGRISYELSKIEKKIDQLLGEDVKKQEIKNINNINNEQNNIDIHNKNDQADEKSKVE
ncbi:MAG: hypothetical protein N4A64_13350 [Marinisporobacter sp.]|jgi:hypothetical protein|nr:hypothetical protein [Marinisporobacter sp.]